jgi:hypothetical protein
MTMPENFVALFEKVKARFDQQPQHGLVCRSGYYKNSFVLKLQKAAWTNDSMDGMQNTSGIFFSVWINEASIKQTRANYNIHALKLRHQTATPSPVAILPTTSELPSPPFPRHGPTSAWITDH